MDLISIQGFDHITFAVSNLRQSIGFYRDVLGAQVVRETSGYASLKWGPLEISVSQRPELCPIQSQLGFQHVAVRVTEVEFFRAITWLKSQNVRFASEVSTRGEGWSVNFFDPDGIELELHAPKNQ